MSNITRLVLVRHVASTWSDAGLLQGLQNPPLSDRGKRQLPFVARVVQHACEGLSTEIVSSSLHRALETAQFLSDNLGNVPIYACDELREVSFGIWESRPEASLADDPLLKLSYDRIDVDFCWPGSKETLRERGYRASDFILSRLRSHPNVTTILVSHGLILQVTLAQLLFNDMSYARTLDIELGSVSVLEYHQADESFVARWIGVPGMLFTSNGNKGNALSFKETSPMPKL